VANAATRFNNDPRYRDGQHPEQIHLTPKFGTLRPNRRQQAASHPSSLIGWNTDLRESEALGLRLAL